MKLKTALAALATLASLFALPAAANTITINGGAGSLTCNDAAAGACSAIIGGSIVIVNPGQQATPGSAGSLSATNADEYDAGSASASNTAAALNILAGTSFTGTGAFHNGNQIAGSGGSGNNPDDTINTTAAWLVLKIGQDSIFIKNLTGGLLTIKYDSFTGQGSGLSHTSEFGDAAVPLPAAVWLMGAGLAGLGFAGRRKKAV